MNSEEFKIVMSSETDKAVSNLQKADKAFDSVAKTAKQATDVLKGAGPGFDAVVRSAERLENKMPALSKVTVNANGALSGLNNIIRDAPYGIIGVGNNITQLTDAFVQMKAQTGSATAALRMLASGIFSPAGLLTLGLSAGISLWTAYSQRQLQAGKSSEEAGASIKSTADIIEYAGKSAAGSIAQVEILRTKLSDLNASQQDRTKALDAYNKIADKANQINIKDIDNLSKINQLLNDQIHLLQDRAIAAAAQKALETAAANLFEVQRKTAPILGRTTQFLEDQSEAAAEATRNVKGLRIATEDEVKSDGGFAAAAKSSLTELANIRNTPEYKQAEKELQAATANFNKILGDVSDLVTFDGISDKGGKEIKKIYTAFSDLNTIAGQTILTFSQFSHLKGFGIQGLTDMTNDVVTQTKTLDTALSGFQYTAQQRLQGMIKPIQETAKELKVAFGGAVEDAIEGITSGLIQGGLGDAIKNFSGVLGGFLQNLGKQLIKTSGILEGLQIAIGTGNPAAAAIAGLAAIAAGAALKAYATKMPAFAQGGITNGEIIARLGDNPGGREAVIPSQDWREAFNMFSAPNGGYIAETRISGGDLYLLVKQAAQEAGRF